MMGMLAALREERTAPVLEELKRRAAKESGALLESNQAFIAMLEQDRDAFEAPFDAMTAHARDPENLFYMSLMAVYVGDAERALTMLERAVAGGWFCHATIASEPWLLPLRKTDRFAAVIAEAEAGHRRAAAAFTKAGGARLLGLP